MNSLPEEYTSNVDMSNVHKTIQEYTENHENLNEGLLSTNHENKPLELIEKEFEDLMIKQEIITDNVQMIVDRNNLSNDQITTIKTEMNKIQNKMENMQDIKITNELESAGYFNAIVDKMVEIDNHIEQFIVEVDDLKLAVEDAYENKKTITEIMEVSEYLRAQYVMQVTENQRNFTEQINKHVSEIDRLKAYANIKVKEIDTLKKRANIQKLSIDSYEKSMEIITHKLSNFFMYIKQLQNENDQLMVPNKNQNNFFLLLTKQLEEMDEILKTTKKKDRCMKDYPRNEFEEHINNLDEEKELSID
ncbi:uncharacterized protein LOC113558736 [Rhopalosiphum maidis]|uniref:uncharacterized protein LOC113558736 n=1 Tax=Rhopalosiphum maidis TaxID=43146 RepID=UPI000EFE6633|nr:uncharacterized protein LOC113558736 [Rhopalosiphum maidis]